MDELNIATIDLGEVPDVSHEERLEKMYDWHFADSAERAKILFGTALSSLLTLLFDFIKGDTQRHPVLAGGVALVGFVSLLIGWLYFRRVREISGDYVEGLKLVGYSATGSEAFRRLLRTFYGGRP